MMDGSVQLNLLSFKKRENTTDYEPKVTRFSGKLCQRCNTLYSDKIAFDEHQFVCDANDDIQQQIDAEQSISIGAETTICSMPTLSETAKVYNQNDIDQIKCEMCPERFSSVWKCKNHMQKVHLGYMKQDTQTKTRQKGGSSLFCDVCEKKCASRTQLEEHRRIHTGEKPYQCSYCNKTFRIEVLLQTHERTHTGERPYQCVDCPKAFRTPSALLRHKKQVHLGEKPYECDYCSKAFGQKVSMQQHVQTVHFKQPWKYLSKSRLLRKLTKESSQVQKQKQQVEVEYDYDSDY